MKLLIGLILGIIFGFLIKRSRICYVGTIRDIYLENKSYNLVLVLSTIMIEALVNRGLIYAGIADPPSFMCYSAIALPVGSFIFGFGAVMMSGCMTMTLVKSGDGRLMGLISLVTFIVVGYFFTGGPGNIITGKLLMTYQLVDVNVLNNDSTRFLVSLVIASILYYLMYKNIKEQNRRRSARRFALDDSQNSSLATRIFKSRWKKETGFIATGVVLGITFPISDYFGRIGGFAITTPILSYAYSALKPATIVGG